MESSGTSEEDGAGSESRTRASGATEEEGIPGEDGADGRAEAEEGVENAGDAAGVKAERAWKLSNGVTFRGRKIRIDMVSLEFDRHRGKVRLNQRPLESYPEDFLKIIRSVVSDAEREEIADNASLRRWATRRGKVSIPGV
ncbi:MAG: hypothetical protein Q4C47_04805, partial [Planctomycetia bacterium]|nr:hypothetical protein [Planctomycetia bacterium]